MKIKKLIVFGLALTMTISVLSGCGNSDSKQSSVSSSSQKESSQTTSSATQSGTSQAASESSVTEDKGITFPLEESVKYTVLMLQHDTEHSVKDNYAWNAFLEYGNIEVEMTEIPYTEAKEKANLIVAGGNYPDFLYKMSQVDGDKYGMDGIFIPLEDLIREYMPNLSARLDEGNRWKILEASDGHIYSLPSIEMGYFEGFNDNCIWINQKWLDKVGLPMPTDMESLYQALKAFKEQDPNGNGKADEIPFSFTDPYYKLLFSYIGDMSYYNPTEFAVKDGELVYSPYTESFYEGLEWLAKMYKEGLIEDDCFVQTVEQQRAQGRGDNIYGCFVVNAPGYMVPDENITDYLPIAAFVPENMARGNGISKNGFMITDKCENPEILCAWMDYCYTEEGGRLMVMGPEGVAYETDANGYYRWTYEDKNLKSTQTKMQGKATLPCYIDPYLYYGVDPATLATNVKNWTYVKWDHGSRGIYDFDGVRLPYLSYTEEEQTIMNDLQTDIGGYIDNYIAQVVVGELSLENSWETFQSTIKSMGSEEMLKIAKTAYERATAE